MLFVVGSLIAEIKRMHYKFQRDRVIEFVELPAFGEALWPIALQKDRG
tara:strand:+ start:481 stop:624 length:144 start_codon:yes stop_codon:yes gene_type:complete